MTTPSRAPVPFSFFGIAVGLLAMANAWRVAARLWHLPAVVADVAAVPGLALWGALLALVAWRSLRDRAGVAAELAHPVQSSYAALVAVASLLAANVLLPYSRPLAEAVLFGALALHVVTATWLHGRFWQGDRAQAAVPAMYLPATGQNFVAATALASFGWPGAGMLFFGAGLLSWLAIESVLLQRASAAEPMAPALRPSLGIQLAPPVVGGVSYLALTSGTPDLFAHALLGYGLFQAVLLARLLPWIRAQAFTPGYWGFSFGVAALPTLAMRMVERGSTDAVAAIALPSFVLANGIIAVLAWKTLALWLGGRLLPAGAPAPAR
jgi:tellurite resistance protein